MARRREHSLQSCGVDSSRRLSVLLSLAVSIAAVSAFAADPAWSSQIVRHVLKAWGSTGVPFVEGEISRAAQDGVPTQFRFLDGGQLVLRSGGGDFAFPDHRGGDYGQVAVTSSSIQIAVGSVFRFPNGQKIQILSSAKGPQSFDISGIHAATPLAAGWNYLFLKKSGASLSVVAAPSVSPNLSPSGDYSYLAAVFADISGESPTLLPMTKVRNRTFLTTALSPTISEGPNVIALDLPATATVVHVWAESRHNSAPYYGCFSYPISDGNGVCASGQIRVPKSASGSFSLLLEGAAPAEQGPVQIQIQGFEESLDQLR